MKYKVVFFFGGGGGLKIKVGGRSRDRTETCIAVLPLLYYLACATLNFHYLRIEF